MEGSLIGTQLIFNEVESIESHSAAWDFVNGVAIGITIGMVIF
ncbi:hypothetical protein SN811_00520 [Ligilactobacillus agilis]|uniref:Uncharacterized protein n=1 Tax=Ligilactobacillus agilis TaxID=1601 RepID=A0A6F9Y238_9LACO|nr:hypothetical protein [Ligilactobacillus agilis]GET11552.1 hypothetical protein SN811_00520 [Ligilactobacillus agilis]